MPDPFEKNEALDHTDYSFDAERGGGGLFPHLMAGGAARRRRVGAGVREVRLVRPHLQER